MVQAALSTTGIQFIDVDVSMEFMQEGKILAFQNVRSKIGGMILGHPLEFLVARGLNARPPGGGALSGPWDARTASRAFPNSTPLIPFARRPQGLPMSGVAPHPATRHSRVAFDRARSGASQTRALTLRSHHPRPSFSESKENSRGCRSECASCACFPVFKSCTRSDAF
jgi:hypothetical protein